MGIPEGPYTSEFISIENEARRHRLGLREQHNPQPPWKFRQEIKANSSLGSSTDLKLFVLARGSPQRIFSIIWGML